MAEVYTGASTWMLQVLSKNEYPVIMLQTSFSCTCDAVTAKTFTCYPQLTWHPAVYIVASPALSGTINLPSPFSPITDQLIDPLQLKTFPSFLCTQNQTRKWKGSSIICQGRVERPRLPFCKMTNEFCSIWSECFKYSRNNIFA